MTPPSAIYGPEVSHEVHEAPVPDKGMSWQNTLALAGSSLLAAILMLLLSPLLLVAALWLGCSKFTGR